MSTSSCRGVANCWKERRRGSRFVFPFCRRWPEKIPVMRRARFTGVAISLKMALPLRRCVVRFDQHGQARRRDAMPERFCRSGWVESIASLAGQPRQPSHMNPMSPARGRLSRARGCREYENPVEFAWYGLVLYEGSFWDATGLDLLEVPNSNWHNIYMLNKVCQRPFFRGFRGMNSPFDVSDSIGTGSRF